MKKLFLLAFALIIQACSNTLSYSDIHINDTVELHQTLTIQPNDARVSIQYGKVVDYSKVESYYPHCWFLSWKRKKEAQPINMDTFVITKVRQTTFAVKLKTGGYLLAALFTKPGISAMEYSTEFELYSDKQPDIKKLICSHWEDPFSASHLTLESIQKTLGDIATIHKK